MVRYFFKILLRSVTDHFLRICFHLVKEFLTTKLVFQVCCCCYCCCLQCFFVCFLQLLIINFIALKNIMCVFFLKFSFSFLFIFLINETIHICDALRNLVPFVQFKKHEKHPWKSANFSKVAG